MTGVRAFLQPMLPDAMMVSPSSSRHNNARTLWPRKLQDTHRSRTHRRGGMEESRRSIGPEFDRQLYTRAQTQPPHRRPIHLARRPGTSGRPGGEVGGASQAGCEKKQNPGRGARGDRPLFHENWARGDAGSRESCALPRTSSRNRQRRAHQRCRTRRRGEEHQRQACGHGEDAENEGQKPTASPSGCERMACERRAGIPGIACAQRSTVCTGAQREC